MLSINNSVLYLKYQNILRLEFQKIKIYFIKLGQIDEVITKIEELQGKKYRIKGFIAAGGEGCVFDGSQFDNSGVEKECVFKIYQKDKEKEDFNQEIILMKSFESPINVIKYFDFLEINIKEDQFYILVLEKCKQSLQNELNMFINKTKTFTQDLLLKIIFDSLDGLIQLRMYNILHLDIKPHNILINKQGDYILTDFGLSSKMGILIKNKGFTAKYAPIEQIQEGQLDFKSDVFALGETLSEVIETFKTTNQNSEDSFHTILKHFEDVIQNRMKKDEVYERDNCQNLHELFFQFINTSEFIQFHLQYINRINLIIELFPYDENKDRPFFQKQIQYYSLIKLQLQQRFDQYFKQNIQQIQQSNQNDQKLFIYQEQYENNQFDIACSLNTVGLCYQEIGEQNNALTYLLESLKKKKLLYLGDHLDVALSLHNIGSCYQKVGDFNFALQYMQQSLDMKKEKYKENNLDIALSLNNIGLCHKKHGDYQKALIYLFESIEILKQIFNESHPYISLSLSRVGECYKILENQAMANKYKSYSSEMKKQLQENPATYSLYDHRQNNQNVKFRQNIVKYEFESLEMSKYLFQENNPDIIMFINEFGVHFYTLIYSQNVLKYLLQKLEKNKQIFQGYHPDIVLFLNKESHKMLQTIFKNVMK